MPPELTEDAKELLDQIEEALSAADDNLDARELATFSTALRDLVERYRAKYRKQ